MGRLAAGIDLGGTKILGRVLDLDAPRVAVAEMRVDTPRGEEAVADAVVALAADLARHVASESGEDLVAVGVGVPGLVDNSGVLRVAPNLPGVHHLDLARRFREGTGTTVLVDNDANCAAWAEHRVGAAVGSRDVLLVTLGTGIGCGLVIDGVLRRGAHGFAGEPGHMLVDPDGPPCPCGRNGCWERYASGSGLGAMGREAASSGNAPRIVALAGGDAHGVRGEHVTAAAAEGDPAAVEVVRRFAWWVALGLANLVNVLDPEVVVVGGGLADAGEVLTAPVREAFDGLVLAAAERGEVRIVPAALGPEAGSIGAALLAADAVGAAGAEGASEAWQ